MTVLSLAFLGWVAATVPAYWLAPRDARPWVLAGLTVVFVALLSPTSAGLLVAFTAITWLGLQRAAGSPTTLVVAGVVVLTGLLAFKVPAAGLLGPELAEVAVPLGLSYYALRFLHLLMEAYRGALPRLELAHVVSYALFLPTILAGPIHRFGVFRRDLRRQRWDPALFTRGLERIVLGAARIAVLGNFLVSHELVRRIAPLEDSHPALFAYLDCVRYGLNLYFQFAGYSDVAIGFALLLGFRVMENFDRPFLRPNIAEFWRGWHISLSSWCRDYVYLPVLSSARRGVPAVLASMVVLGLWHELSPRYLAWGAMHGSAIVVFRLFERLKPRLPSPRSAAGRTAARVLATLVTVNFVMLSFAFTKEPDLRSGVAVWLTIFTGGP